MRKYPGYLQNLEKLNIEERKQQHQIENNWTSQGQSCQIERSVCSPSWLATREGTIPKKHNKMLSRETLRTLVPSAELKAAQNKPSRTLSPGREGPGRGKEGEGQSLSTMGHFREKKKRNVSGMSGLFHI